ncbi:MAG: sugar transferase [Candidatus Omnitrophica bacterium]|nr:sugar transferase [Candidatus Omnitrophota bacterium]MDD5429836.1 sugar transferase [Candidatus Omnitrophota bacterium]
MQGCKSKRILDVILSLFGLFFLMPFFIMFAFLIWLEDGKGIFYSQKRVGLNNKKFTIFKFRSMSRNSEEVPSYKLKDSKAVIEITPIGKFLRASAMDEALQLINILKGEMSFVGPRPIMPREVALLNPDEAALRSSVVPGLTGLAQIFLDKYVPNEEKIKYDLQYIQKRSFLLDFQLIMRSLYVTFWCRWERPQR